MAFWWEPIATVLYVWCCLSIWSLCDLTHCDLFMCVRMIRCSNCHDCFWSVRISSFIHKANEKTQRKQATAAKWCPLVPHAAPTSYCIGPNCKLRHTPTCLLMASPTFLPHRTHIVSRVRAGGGDRDHVLKTLLTWAIFGISWLLAVALHNKGRFR